MTVPERASLNLAPMAVTTRLRGLASVRATLVRPVLGVDAGETGEGLGGHEDQGHVPLDADAAGVLGLQGAYVLDGDPLAAVDAVEAFGSELDGEDAAGVVAGLAAEATVYAVLGVGDEVVDEDGDVVVEVDRPVQGGGLAEGQVPALGAGELLDLAAAAPAHDEGVGRAWLHQVDHLVQLGEGAGAAGGAAAGEDVLSAGDHGQGLLGA